MADLLSDLMVAPTGIAVRARLEAMHRAGPDPWSPPSGVASAAVRDAAAWLATAGIGDVIEVILEAADYYAGPWWSSSPRSLAQCFTDSPARRPIAEELVDRFGDELAAPIDRRGQEWWSGVGRWASSPRFEDVDQVYDSGEFSFGGLFTYTTPPAQAHDLLAAAQELFPGPIGRMALPVRDEAEIWEIHGPEDWARLVLDHPKLVGDDVIRGGWELPGRNQVAANVADLVAVAGATACRTHIDGHQVPDWASVATAIDGVHLSWAGYLTTEGRVVDLPDGTVTMLRFWGSECTLWLADVFGAPDALSPPNITDHDNNGGRDWSEEDWQHRAETDLALVKVLLGRQ